MTQGSLAIELIGIVKEFNSHGDIVKAVAGVDIEIGVGEFFSLLGPSGCGKTTTMRMIAGFEEPTSGEVKLYGKSVLGVPPNKRDVNMVFQSYALFPHMSVFENVAFGLRRKGVAKDEVTKRVSEIIETVGLAGREKRRPRELSGGQQQRVALARALVNRPRALLLDEPLGALDLKLRQAMQIELKRIQREGVIEQLAAPRDIYEHPKTRFVAGFIGTSNLLNGTVTSTDLATGGAVIDLGANGGRIVVPAAGKQPGDELEITVRPEKITLVADGAGAALPAPAGQHDCALRGTVTEVVYLGTSTNYNVTTSAGAEVVVYSQNSANDASGPQRGEQVWLHWDSANSYAIGNTQ